MNLIAKDQQFIFQTYRRQPLQIDRAKGVWVWDAAGKKYLDFFSGLAVNNLGHCHPALLRAIAAQSKKILHASNLYYTRPQLDCAERLVMRSFQGKVFFANSGAEANECAFKISRRWGHFLNDKKKFEVIAFQNSFHGRTMATLTLTGQTKYQKNFDPLVAKVRYARFNDIASVEKLISHRTSAVIIEPIQGEGGVCVADKKFLKALKILCRQHQALLIFDEVQCGMGRTGKLFAFEHYGLQPDILTLAKGLGGGLPIGAVVASDRCAKLLQYGDHASTFGGNPVSCAVATAVLKTLDKIFLDAVTQKGNYFAERLQLLQKKYPQIIAEVRGQGLMLGCELKILGADIVRDGLAQGLLINCTQDKVLRFLPPLTITKKEIDIGIKILENVLEKC